MADRIGPNLMVFDIETGGFKATTNPLVEVSFICYDSITSEEVGRYEAIVKPYYEHPITKAPLEYTAGAMKVHGITIAQMESEGKDLKVVLKEILAFIKQMKLSGRFGKCMIAGHNILSFDIPFLDECMSWFNINWMAELNEMPLDTMHFFRMIYPQTKKHSPDAVLMDHKLETCCNAVGVQLTNAHRASADVEANGQMILRLLTMMRGGTVESSLNEKIDNGSQPYKF